ncbi:MAG: aminotransferase class I/II-fold pyridoxal phosphate-dependent enzyme [Solirubrobacteraceae bacterium]|nr:aminotransferase class I/II-fold pyridoxal phosphate-dependent enzyme [Solirubrobacteraceae bacterium]
MGIRDYYKQFEELSPEEVSAQLREQADERRRAALAIVEPLNLATTTWPEYPHSNVVNAITFAARRGLQRYLDRHATALRSELAHHHGVEPERLVVGDGAAQLLGAATQALMDEPHDELITPWPSYPLYPLMARRARAHAVPVDGFGIEPVLAAVNERTRIVALCNPNDPTGELLGLDDLGTLLERLPERVVVLLDEALIDFVDPAVQARDASLALLGDHPRLLVFRTFSKAWGLAGLRCGYAIGGPGAEPLLERLEPELGLNELAQAGALEALRSSIERVARRGQDVVASRAALTSTARELGYDVTDSQANVLWLALEGVDGAELSHRLERAHVVVASGGPLGDSAHVRLTVPTRAEHMTRVVRALELARG